MPDCPDCQRLREALRALMIDANRLCDRNLGGTDEEDCRRSIAEALVALLAASRPAAPQEPGYTPAVHEQVTTADLRWWADTVANRPGTRTPWEQGLVQLLRGAADAWEREVASPAAPQGDSAEDWPCTYSHHTHASREEAVECARPRRGGVQATADEDYRAYAIRQLQIAREKEADAPASAQMHEEQAAFALREGRIPAGIEVLRYLESQASPAGPSALTEDDWREIEAAVRRAPTFAAHTRKKQEQLVDRIRRARIAAAPSPQERPVPGERCPRCSFDPVSLSDYCDEHRPSPQEPKESDR